VIRGQEKRSLLVLIRGRWGLEKKFNGMGNGVVSRVEKKVEWIEVIEIKNVRRCTKFEKECCNSRRSGAMQRR